MQKQYTPSRKNRWGEVLSELAVQQNLLHELLASEGSRSNSASRSRSPRNRRSATPRRPYSVAVEGTPSVTLRRSLISPSPDPARTQQPTSDAVSQSPVSSPQRWENPGVRNGATDTNRPRQRSSAAPESAGPKAEAVANLMEALSTSSWSSEETDRSTVLSEGNRELARGGKHEQAPTTDRIETDRGTRHRFFAAAMALIDDEYDARQAIVLAEMMHFTEMSSVYLLTAFTSTTPERL